VTYDRFAIRQKLPRGAMLLTVSSTKIPTADHTEQQLLSVKSSGIYIYYYKYISLYDDTMATTTTTTTEITSKNENESCYSDSELKDTLYKLYTKYSDTTTISSTTNNNNTTITNIITMNPNEHLYGYNNDWNNHNLSMLQKITATVLLEYEKKEVSITLEELEQQGQEFIKQNGDILNLQTIIQQQSQQQRMALAAEYKRASPSKGRIASDHHMDAAQQAIQYTIGGANIVSCLTEPKYFQGTLHDLTNIRIQTQKLYTNQQQQQQQQIHSRPVILRKDFVISKYMIAEAVAAGADTVLLIVAILPIPILYELIQYCTNQFQMVPLVEVHTDLELDIALAIGATCIGINNRNLHTFQLDLTTSERIAQRLTDLGRLFRPEDINEPTTTTTNEDMPYISLCALSGMSTCYDVDRFRKVGITMCLIGESLMRSNDLVTAIASLCLHQSDFEKMIQSNHDSTTTNGISSNDIVVSHNTATVPTCTASYTSGTQWIKICGITNVNDALIACQAGANVIGIIFAEKSKRRIASTQDAKCIVDAVHKFGERNGRIHYTNLPSSTSTSSNNPIQHIVRSTLSIVQSVQQRPIVVGVFQNQDMDYICEMIDICGLDMIQLHGNEGMKASNRSNYNNVPVIRVVDITIDPDTGHTTENAVDNILKSLTNDPSILLLDTAIKHGGTGGGTGMSFDWNIASHIQDNGIPVIVAGGLKPETIADCIHQIRPFGVDVSSGVELQPGLKDHTKVRSFINAARSASFEANKGF
jgi:indole-3-glycerol phosphate synthase/phosphoribosylanthranilate isomerase